jgi:hypothetical protein
VGSHISKIDGVYVCSFTAAETKNRREFQLAPSKVPETGLGERAERAGARPVVGFGKASLNRRVRGHEIPIPDAVA